MSEFLLELFSEEIPARMQAKAASDLKNIFTNALTKGGVKFKEADCYVTARRLVLHIQGLDAKTPDISVERRGPRADAPEKAIEGFLKGAGVTRDQVEIREEKKGTFLYAVIEQKGISTKKALEEIFISFLSVFPWPKSMRWGNYSIRWIRPLHSVLAIFDGQSLDLSFSVTEGDPVILYGNMTCGHRFLAPNAFAVTSFADYKQKLVDAFVVLDPAERRALIKQQAHKLAAEAGLALLEDEALLDEVVGLAEFPVVLMGAFDKDFLDVPQEALTSAMRAHQKYFSVLDATGKLSNKFIFVSNMKTEDNGAKIIDGNQRVLRARLADTKFFWDQDLKHRLEDNLPKLNDIIFHEKLGTVGERVERLAQLARWLVEQHIVIPAKAGIQSQRQLDSRLRGNDRDVAKLADQAERAARLCKADLVSGMVGEFADLQGVMGKYYAEKQDETAAVANAIAEHYSPKGPSDICPSDPVSIAVALAEKLDTLVGFFGIDEKPTGSKDPFALRRAALGILRLIVENNLRLSLVDFIDRGQEALAFVENEEIQTKIIAKAISDKDGSSTVVKSISDLNNIDSNLIVISFETSEYLTNEIMNFFADRLKVHLKEQGVRHDLITAVFALGSEDDLVRLLARVEALQNFLGTEEGVNLLAGYKRAANILKAEEKKDGEVTGTAMAGTLPEEKELFARLTSVSAATKTAVDQENFEEAMSALATLRPTIDAFFDKVTVNSDDKGERLNRLRLLTQIRSTMNTVADFSKIEG